MQFKRISARYLLNFTTEQLWGMLAGRFILRFDDGEDLLTNYKEVLYSSYFWDFHRRYGSVPLLKKHHVVHVLNNEPMMSRTHISLLESIYWDVVDHLGLNTPAVRDEQTRMIYEVVNHLYNDLCCRVESHVTSIDILDCLEITDNPAVRAIRAELRPTQESIAVFYKKLGNILEKDPSLDNNTLVRATRAKTVKQNQLLQCVGVRGILTDVDSVFIPTPIMRNFTEGMRTAFNILAESRAAAKALYFSEEPLQDAEYFARRLQLLCMTVERVHYVDCGSQNYILWYVKPAVREGGRVTYQGDLKFMVGKYYLDETTSTLKVIGESDQHLQGTYIKMRSVLGCSHHDHKGVCAVCFGRMSDNLNPSGNLGHVSSVDMTEQTTQNTLGTKHLTASSVSEPIILGEAARRFFIVSRDNNSYLLNKEAFINHKVNVIVTPEEAYGLTDIMLAPSISDIHPSRISEIDYVGFEVVEGDASNTHTVCVSQNRRFAMFSYELLEYLRKYKWSHDKRGNFVFDMTHWDFTKPVFKLPEMEYSYAHHGKQVARVIESKVNELSDRIKPGSPSTTLVELFDLVNNKLSVNIALLEVVIYASMVRDGVNHNYDLARNSVVSGMGVADATISNRSLGPVYAYESQHTEFVNPRSFYADNRPDSVLDVFICPREVVEDCRA